ncbi:MAG: asparagine synthase (glutamine-hydrolysing) [Planctomycetota bacterium]|nr:MAG: asparagine synthase (glutamine-hydrolysing) [Planctomycetota bacterium]
MCGIAGYLHVDRQRPADAELLRRMSDAIVHRGPDGSGAWFGDGVGLAHRRLSIIDLEGGRQPLGNEDNSIQVVFNGEIYNYRELRTDLERRGHVFRTHSDTEVLVHLLLARDRVGIKPLYVFRNSEWLLFGSELKTLLAHPAVPRNISPTALDDYFTFGMIPGDATIFRGVEKLPPAHVLTVHADSWTIRTQRYWQLDFTPDESLTLPQWKEAVADKLRETVKAHLVADVPVGAFLSGGLDSSMIVAEATAQNPSLLRTFSIGFRESRFNELPHARAIAEHFGTEHVEEIVTADAASLLPQLTHFYDEPFADSSAIPTFLVSKLAAQHVKVVLSGDGGDEALGGYSRYAHDLKEASLRQLLPRWLRRTLLAGIARAWPKLDWLPRPLRLKSALTNLSLDPDAAYANTLTLCRQPGRSRLLSSDVWNALSGHDSQRIAREAFARACQTGKPDLLRTIIS